MFYYIHIPFCRQKCAYCKFALTPFVRDFQITQYIAHLIQEITEFSQSDYLNSFHREVQSIYFGGGTPSVLTVNQIGKILETCRLAKSGISGAVEITLEANPEDITKEWVDGVMALGVNRISLGVQSLREDTLRKIGRGGVDGIFHALDILQLSGIHSVNIDWIIGLPYETQSSLIEAVTACREKYSCITHMSVYFLEKGEYPKDWNSLGMSDADQKSVYSRIRELLLGGGWHHYEVSNFAKPGYESRHNSAYWNHSAVRGFGLSAASYLPNQEFERGVSLDDQSGSNMHGAQDGLLVIEIDAKKNSSVMRVGRRFENSSTFSGYYGGKLSYDEWIDEVAYRLESGMFGLRTFRLPEAYFLKSDRIDELCEEGLLEKFVDAKFVETKMVDVNIVDTKSTACIRPTIEGIFLIDTIMSEIL